MATIDPVTTSTMEGDIAVIAVDAPPVNALTAPVRAGLARAVEQAVADDAVTSIVILCEGRTFFAGADITAFEGPAGGPEPQTRAQIESSPKPVVAAIHGTALGSGLGLALSCHHRVAVPSAEVGFPEVGLGLVPGGGGTQLLTRLVGVEAALDMVTTGRHVPAEEALAMGLLDELVEEGNLRAGALAFARKVIDEQRPLRRARDQDEKVEAARGRPEIFTAFRQANARRFRGFRAPEAGIQCIEAAVDLPFEDGLAVERRLLGELLATPESAALRYSSFAERRAREVPDIPADTPLIPVQSVGVLGAGTMGGGIAMNFANVGIPVTIVEREQAALERGLGIIRGNYERTAARGGITAEEVERRMGLITGSLSMEESFADVDMVIEAVFERMALKKDVFADLDAICKPGAILATNTSGLNVDEIAAVTQRPESVIGLHFFSPANVMKLLEIVRGERSSREVVATSMELATRIRKVGVVVGVCPGFVANRINGARGRETQKLLLEGAAPWDIDRALYDFGYAMGPFRTSDLAGLDIGWVKEESKSATIREVLCEMDRRGQKTGAGYYDYDADRNAIPSPVTEQVIKDFRAKAGVEPRKISDEEIVERCVYPLINEALKVLEEGKATRASDIDVIFVNGSGWPAYRGGPMFYGDQVGGPAKVLARMRELQAAMGDEYRPAPLLEELAAEGKPFSG